MVEQLQDPDATVNARAARVAAGDPATAALIDRMLRVAVAGLPLMLRPEDGHFAHTRFRDADGQLKLSGVSRRYAAIVLLGAARAHASTQRLCLGGRTAAEYCDWLGADVERWTDLGDVALLGWAAAELGRPLAHQALSRVVALFDSDRTGLTVPTAWALSAAVAARRVSGASDLERRARERVLSAFDAAAGVFGHHRGEVRGPWHRDHVACFADQVYPIQALARLHALRGDREALAAANRCAKQICDVQGPDGQWWWHYDRRTGAVVEGYPVYSVHQDGMAPMALLDLLEAGGDDHRDAIRLGVQWMARAPEIGHSLIDDESKLIWRKVGRTDPRKAVRGLRALATRVTPTARLAWLDRLYRPSRIDFESRPYHLGWVLYAWLGRIEGVAKPAPARS